MLARREAQPCPGGVGAAQPGRPEGSPTSDVPLQVTGGAPMPPPPPEPPAPLPPLPICPVHPKSAKAIRPTLNVENPDPINASSLASWGDHRAGLRIGPCRKLRQVSGML